MTTHTMTELSWQWSPFRDLTIEALYELMALRQRVFIVEQQCPYVDADGLDPVASHLLGWQEGPEPQGRRLVASARIFDRVPGAGAGAEPEAFIGRVVTDRSVRGNGIGRLLMAEAISRCESQAPGLAIRIQAQSYLKRFYEGFGFHRTSPPYLYDGIVHLDMVRPAGQGVGT